MTGSVSRLKAATPSGELTVDRDRSSATNVPPLASTAGTYVYQASIDIEAPYTATLSLSKPGSSPCLPLASTVKRLHIAMNSSQVQPSGFLAGSKSVGGLTPASLAMRRLM